MLFLNEFNILYMNLIYYSLNVDIKISVDIKILVI